jgi:hypothetical protein
LGEPSKDLAELLGDIFFFRLFRYECMNCLGDDVSCLEELEGVGEGLHFTFHFDCIEVFPCPRTLNTLEKVVYNTSIQMQYILCPWLTYINPEKIAKFLQGQIVQERALLVGNSFNF